MFDFNPLLASISILTGLSLIFVFRWLGRVKNNYPPGPKGIPVFGNIFQLSKRAGRDFEKWAKKYGKGLQCVHSRRPRDADNGTFVQVMSCI